jgi:hypothetical protein
MLDLRLANREMGECIDRVLQLRACRLVIIAPGCRYVPVPYVLPSAAHTQYNVYNIELISE